MATYSAGIDDGTIVDPIAEVAKGAHIEGMEAYNAEYERSIKDPSKYWGEKARELLHWFRDFDAVQTGSFETGDIAWFLNGKLNLCTNCVDRHVPERGDETAIIWEKDDREEDEKITYKQLLHEVCRIANVMKRNGVKKGDVVTVYMPMMPELIYVMLACARIGAPHSVVFAGFSSDSLKDRIEDGNSKFLFVSDEGLRGGRTLKLKSIADEAIAKAGGLVQKQFVFKRTGNEAVAYNDAIDVRMEDAMAAERPFCPAEAMDAEDPLFLLYTSGSTGKPKGVMHTTAGYLLYTTLTHKVVFDYRPGDVYACVADCGWITGHSYIAYGPLSNGATTLMFESTPLHPDPYRYWDLVQKHKVTQFYTAPTAIRALMKYPTEGIEKYDLSSLRILGTVGEPINPEAWRWYFDNIGKKKCYIVDTFWQTETGGHMLTPLPGATPMKPGSCCKPFFGVDPVVLEPESGKIIEGNDVKGVLCFRQPWPSITRTVFGDHQRYMTTYLNPYKGYYFTGDGCCRDKDGYYWITGRVDDVVNVSGHRLGTAEIESSLVLHEAVAEAAVIGTPHDVKGETLACYVILVEGQEDTPELCKALRQQVRSVIGAFATPEYIIPTPALPKTRSGKIMRRVLRKIIAGEQDQLGDTSTLADPSVVEKLIARVAQLKAES